MNGSLMGKRTIKKRTYPLGCECSGDFNCNYFFNENDIEKQIVIHIVITICLCYTDICEIVLIIDRRTGDAAEKRHCPDGTL